MVDVLLHLLKTGLTLLGEVAVNDDVVRDVLLFCRHLIVVGRVEEKSELMGGQTVSGIVVERVMAFVPGPCVVVFLSVAVPEIPEGVVANIEAKRVGDHRRVRVGRGLAVSQSLSDVDGLEVLAGLFRQVTRGDRVTKAQVRADTEVGSVFHSGIGLRGECRNARERGNDHSGHESCDEAFYVLHFLTSPS